MEPKPANAENTSKNRTCERCGRFDAIEFGEHVLCQECITEAGCACAERDDGNASIDPSKH